MRLRVEGVLGTGLLGGVVTLSKVMHDVLTNFLTQNNSPAYNTCPIGHSRLMNILFK